MPDPNIEAKRDVRKAKGPHSNIKCTAFFTIRGQIRGQAFFITPDQNKIGSDSI